MKRQNSNWKRREQQLNTFLRNLPKGMAEEFKKSTPIRTGNARSKTSLRQNEIQANYAYSVRLEKDGWSRQAPEGMSKPTIEYARGELRKL